MKNLKKILILSILIALGASFLLVSPTKSKIKPYYGGDAIEYNGKIHIGTINTKAFELFVVENGKIYKKTTIASTDIESNEFYDSMFVKEGGKLYVYLVNGRYLYRYDVSNPIVPTVLNKIKDNSWDWFIRLKMVEGKLVTVGSKTIKIWNKDFQVIDSYSLKNSPELKNEKNPENITFSNDGNFIISGKKDRVNIFSASGREIVADFKITMNEESNRTMVNDKLNNLIYVVDDESLKAIDFKGKLKKEFKHISHVGYNVAESADANYLYFSDGLGVVKVRKSDMEAVDWKWTTENSGWAIGIKPVKVGGKENLVVFNCSNILVLNENLEEVDSYEAMEIDLRPIEDLRLGIDKNMGAPNTEVSLRGQGFGLNEDVEIKFVNAIYKSKTDGNGRFGEIITVPSVPAGMNDIKVIGKNSKRTYSISFKIE